MNAGRPTFSGATQLFPAEAGEESDIWQIP